MNDLTLMESEADVYKAISKLMDFSKTLTDTGHLLNFSSKEEESAKFRNQFYEVLCSIHEAQLSTIKLFEMLCIAHGNPLSRS